MMQKLQHNVFHGSDGLKTYLNPQNGQFTPMVELPPSLNPYANKNIHIYAKLLSAMPLGNVKSIPAYFMLDRAGETGKTKIIESSSGNTVASLGVLAGHFGYEETHALVSHEVTQGKLDMLRLFGVTPIINKEPICPSENDETSGIKKARKLGLTASWFNPDQYGNQHNIESHYNITGPQINQQLNGEIDYFFSSMGTTGTMMGSSRYLKETCKGVKTIGVVRAPNNPIPGPRTKNLLEEVSFEWSESCDDLVEVGTRDAFQTSLSMIRQGLLVGPSSGMALDGVYRYIETHPELFDNDEKQTIVFICCDTPLPYMDEYFSIIPEDQFPTIKNKHLMLSHTQDTTPHTVTDMSSISSPDLYEAMQLDQHAYACIDLRSHDKFDEYHIPHAINIAESDFISHIGTFSALYAKKKIILICEQGLISGLIARYAQAKGLQAMSLEGGLMDWSLHHYPRVKNTVCGL
jgi:cysteine synthase/rhodanese-related sulfurtransferase